MSFPEPTDIFPAQFRSWLTRQGWKQVNEYLWVLSDETRSEPWSVKVVARSNSAWEYFNAETIVRLAHIYCCRQWEIEAVLKVEPIALSPDDSPMSPMAHGTIELFDQVERLDVGDGKFVELTDHNPAQIIVDDDGADLLIAAIVSARYGWGSSVEAFGRGGGSFTLTIGRLRH